MARQVRECLVEINGAQPVVGGSLGRDGQLGEGARTDKSTLSRAGTKYFPAYLSEIGSISRKTAILEPGVDGVAGHWHGAGQPPPMRVYFLSDPEIFFPQNPEAPTTGR